MPVQFMDEARVVAPERSIVQRMEALHRANEIRTYRAGVKCELRSGRVRVTDLLLDWDERLATMKVFDLMLAVPKVGRVKVNKILVRERISPSKSIGGLSLRQRTALVVALSPYGGSVREPRRMAA